MLFRAPISTSYASNFVLDIFDSMEYINYTLNSMSPSNQKSIQNTQHGMFTESILNYNGHKILTTTIKRDLFLLLVLEKRAYLGLTMLDVECCLREMNSKLDEGWLKIYETND